MWSLCSLSLSCVSHRPEAPSLLSLFLRLLRQRMLPELLLDLLRLVVFVRELEAFVERLVEDRGAGMGLSIWSWEDKMVVVLMAAVFLVLVELSMMMTSSSSSLSDARASATGFFRMRLVLVTVRFADEEAAVEVATPTYVWAAAPIWASSPVRILVVVR